MYKEKTYIAGETIEVEKLHSNQFLPKGGRAKRVKSTPESVKKHNEKISEDKFRRKMNSNFSVDDTHCVLLYKKGYRPTMEEYRKNIKDFLKDMRKEYKKLGLLFKYMYVTGYYDKDGIADDEYDTHNETVIHHHILMNGIDYKIIARVWRKYGYGIKLNPLYGEGDFTDLANYFIEHTKNLFREVTSPSKKRWSCSRNLKDPILKERKIHASSWRKDPVAKKGYKLITDSIKYGVSEVTGYPYMFYRMVKIQNQRK